MTSRRREPGELTAELSARRDVAAAAGALAADVLALLANPPRTRERMQGRRSAEGIAAVALVASAVREMVRRDLAERRAQALPADELMMSRRMLTTLIERSTRSLLS